VASLAELRSFYQPICARKLPVKMAANHGASLAFYFDDPDGNMIEVYWPTGVKCRQPFIEPLDLTQSEEALRALSGCRHAAVQDEMMAGHERRPGRAEPDHGTGDLFRITTASDRLFRGREFLHLFPPTH